ncbi:MAG: hypothetical protein M0036_20790 [Desulfobacteraceae bacterium]|nr:hypothetical protein [Desulfobacteraceae bacterium]
MQAAYTSLHLADWSQTRYIAKHPEQFHETCPALGAHPSTKSVDLWFGATLAGHYLLADLLPNKASWPVFGEVNPRKIFQCVTIGIEAGCVANNYSIGVGFDF